MITEPSVLMAEFSTQVGNSSATGGPQLELFPNPCRDHISILGRSGTPAIRSAEIRSIDGRLAYTPLNIGKASGIDIGSLAGGVYLIAIHLETDDVVILRFEKL